MPPKNWGLFFAYGIYIVMQSLVNNTILFVDDDLDDLEFYGEVLEETIPGVAIREAHSGHEAIEYLQQASSDNTLPCLVILDMNMPLLSGIETIREIKKNSLLENIPIIVFSTARALKEKGLLEALGVECYVKPCSYAEMKEVALILMKYCS